MHAPKLSFAVLLAAALGVACGSPTPSRPDPDAGSDQIPDSGTPQGPEIVSVTVEPHPDWTCLGGCTTVVAGYERVLIAIVKDDTGATRDDVEVVWSSADETLATVDQQGVVSAKKAGLVDIRATAGGITGALTLRIKPARVAKITVTPHPVSVAAGGTVQLQAEAEDEQGNVLDDVVFQWLTANPNLATVDQNGLVTGVAGGVTVIVAKSDRGFGSDGWATLTVTSSEPAPVGFRLTSIALAAHHGCGVGVDGETYCWGWNYFGQLGVDRLDSEQASFPVPEKVVGGHAFAKVAAGGYQSCALEAAGKAWCWGLNDKGQLGTHATIGEVGGTTIPFEVLGGLTFVQLSTAHAHTCAVATNGEGYCWGMGSDGALGVIGTADKPTPTKIYGQTTWTEIVTGLESSCGLATDGKAWCWGRNSQAQLGTGAPTTGGTTYGFPQAVAGDRTWVDISLSSSHVCAVDTDGAAWCWGNNYSGQLGDGTTENRAEPVAVNTTERFVQVAVAAHHSCALQADGEVFCWGNNDSAQLGNGGLAGSLTPTRVLGSHAFAQIEADGNVTCGLTGNGEAYCWGSAYTGETAAGFSGGMLVVPTAVVPPAPPAP